MSQEMVPRFFNRNSKLLIVLTAFCIVILWLYRINLNQRSMIKNTVYSIVIDAGSTGSRLHVFKLNHDDDEDKKFDIELVNEELLLKIEPGLSAYSKNPEKAVDSIEPLLIRALEIIPSAYHSITRISLKATAGLRLISDEIANTILNNIKKLFTKYPFKIKGDEDVSILDGKYEGIYSWLTLNYALNNFDESKEVSVCSLDMGGGSTQITFVPSDQVSKLDSLVNLQIDRTQYKIYAKSFLGFGLMSARLNILEKDTLNFVKNKTKNDFYSNCLKANNKIKWSQQGVDFMVHGPDNVIGNSYENCNKSVVKIFENNFIPPIDLSNKDVYAFSFYFDRLNRAKTFNDKNGGKIRIETIKIRAKSICDTPEADENKEIDKTHKDYDFLCMDLTYIYAILSNGYNLPDHKEIYVSNQVNGMEISWALGAAFHMLNEND